MLVKIRFSEGLSEFTAEDKSKVIGLKLEKEINDNGFKYRLITDNVTQIFTSITSLGYKNKLILSSNKEEGKFCIMELSK